MKIPTFSLSRPLQGDGWELAMEILRTRLRKAGQESEAPWADAAVLDGAAALATDLEPGARKNGLELEPGAVDGRP